MAEQFSVSVDLSDLLSLRGFGRATLFPQLAAEVAQVAATGRTRWQQAALSAPLWEGEAKAYAASIKAVKLDDFSWEIVSDYKFVEDIERGRPPYDLKRMLNTSAKVRTSKKGRRFLIIPFRHNTPGHNAHAADMPQHVYQQARDLAPSRVTGRGSRKSGLDAHDIQTRQPMRVASRKYLWGGRLGAGLAPKLRSHHKSDPYAGMVRFDARTPGGKRYSTYMTFRVMAEGSSGWIIGARPGLWIAKMVAESVQRTADTDLRAAIVRDLDAA